MMVVDEVKEEIVIQAGVIFFSKAAKLDISPALLPLYIFNSCW